MLFGKGNDTNKQEKLRSQPEDEYVEVENVYDFAPPNGTIVGEATQEEMDIAAELEATHYAYSRLMDSGVKLDPASFKELLQEYKEFEKRSITFYRSLHKRLGLPWAWTLRVDIANGPVIVSNEHLDFETEENEDEE